MSTGAAGSDPANPLDRLGRSRVAVTGIGVKTPAGCDVATFWETVLAGRPTAGPITLFDSSELPVKFACEVKDYDPTPYITMKFDFVFGYTDEE